MLRQQPWSTMRILLLFLGFYDAGTAFGQLLFRQVASQEVPFLVWIGTLGVGIMTEALVPFVLGRKFRGIYLNALLAGILPPAVLSLLSHFYGIHLGSWFAFPFTFGVVIAWALNGFPSAHQSGKMSKESIPGP
jgi:hypothetical protein